MYGKWPLIYLISEPAKSKVTCIEAQVMGPGEITTGTLFIPFFHFRNKTGCLMTAFWLI